MAAATPTLQQGAASNPAGAKAGKRPHPPPALYTRLCNRFAAGSGVDWLFDQVTTHGNETAMAHELLALGAHIGGTMGIVIDLKNRTIYIPFNEHAAHRPPEDTGCFKAAYLKAFFPPDAGPSYKPPKTHRVYGGEDNKTLIGVLLSSDDSDLSQYFGGTNSIHSTFCLSRLPDDSLFVCRGGRKVRGGGTGRDPIVNQQWDG